MEQIGGHNNQFGRMLVYQDGVVCHKVAGDEKNAIALRNAARIQRLLEGKGLAPIVHETFAGGLEGGIFTVVEDYLGKTGQVQDGEAFRRACISFLAQVRAAGIRHGDLTAPNIIIQQGGAKIMAVDWAESHLLSEPAPQKQPWADSNLLMRMLYGTPDAAGQMDTPRVAQRWSAVLGALGAQVHRNENPLPLRGKTFVDYGCFMGDFPALAACEGMHAVGVDRWGFRSGENSIHLGQELWQRLGVTEAVAAIGGSLTLIEADVMAGGGDVDVALCFSTWPYLVQDYGEAVARDFLCSVAMRSHYFFFETQLCGDGPGPEFLTTKEEVGLLLESCGYEKVQELGTIPVWGRSASRTVFMGMGRL